MSDDEELMEISFEPEHAAGCNYYLRPLGSPGCICAVVNRNELAELRAEVERLREELAEAEHKLKTWFQRDVDEISARHGRWSKLESELTTLTDQLAAAERERDEARGALEMMRPGYMLLEDSVTTLADQNRRLRSQLAAEREKRAAMVREWRASDGDHYYLAGLEFCADQLEALDKETGDA